MTQPVSTLSPENEAARLDAASGKSSSKPPIVLIPGVGGDGGDYSYVVHTLKKLLPDHPIYVWYDPRHPKYNKGSDASIQPATIQQQASSIKEQLQKIYPQGPYLITGYSFGGNIAHALTQQLEAANQTVNLTIIDAPTAELSRDFLQPDSIKATISLVTLLNYAAKISNLKEVGIDKISKTNLFDISGKEIQTQIALLHALILEHNRGARVGNTSAFLMFFRIIQENIIALLQYSTGSQPIQNLTLLTTKDTAQKHDCKEDLGWSNKAAQLTIKPYDKVVTHTSLLKGDHAIVTALKIADTVKQFVAANAVATISPTVMLQQSPVPNSSSASSAKSTPPRAHDDCRTPSPPVSPHTEIDRMLARELQELTTSSLHRHRKKTKSDSLTDFKIHGTANVGAGFFRQETKSPSIEPKPSSPSKTFG